MYLLTVIVSYKKYFKERGNYTKSATNSTYTHQAQPYHVS